MKLYVYMHELSVFGNIEFIRNSRSRRITVKILPYGLRVSFPKHVRETEAAQFILKNQSDILSRQEQIRKKRVDYFISPDKIIETYSFSIKPIYAKRTDLFFYFRSGILQIEIPENADIQSESLQRMCWNGINHFLRKEAKRILPVRTKELSLQFGFNYTGVKIQSGKTRWGSCSKNRNINLSLFLLLLPPHLVDYVILHELCHTREMNHGDRFWKLMDKVTGGKTGIFRTEMKKFAIP